MNSWHKALCIGVAILAGTASAEAHMAGIGGRSAGGFHGFRGFLSRQAPFHQGGFRIGFANAGFGRARPGGWSGGAYSAGVAGFDDDSGDDFAPGDLHFRVQESFGPGDIGRPAPPPESYNYGPWEAGRMDPWHGYESDNW